VSTSAAALDQHRKSGKLGRQHKAVLALVEGHPASTGAELGAHAEAEGFDELGGDYRHTVGKRLSELADRLLIEKSTLSRPCSITGRAAHTWSVRAARTCDQVGAHLMCNAEKYWQTIGQKRRCRVCGKFLGYVKE